MTEPQSAPRRSSDPLLSEAETKVLRAVAGQMIPAAHQMPSAESVVTDDRVRFVLEARPDLVDPLRSALRAELGSDPAVRLARLETEEDEIYTNLQLVIVGAYYTDSEVRDLLGYPGQVAKPVNALEFPEYLAEDLLDAVIERGAIWRDPEPTERGPN